MKLKYKSLLYILSGALLFSGCTSSFDDLNTNPDTTTKVTSSMLATKTILDMTKSASNWKNEFLVKRMCWGNKWTTLNTIVSEKEVSADSRF